MLVRINKTIWSTLKKQYPDKLVYDQEPDFDTAEWTLYYRNKVFQPILLDEAERTGNLILSFEDFKTNFKLINDFEKKMTNR